ncbi:hypothetical protein MRX96_030201 [Rhipicephalus microplus]
MRRINLQERRNADRERHSGNTHDGMEAASDAYTAPTGRITATAPWVDAARAGAQNTHCTLIHAEPFGPAAKPLPAPAVFWIAAVTASILIYAPYTCLRGKIYSSGLGAYCAEAHHMAATRWPDSLP